MITEKTQDSHIDVKISPQLGDFKDYGFGSHFLEKKRHFFRRKLDFFGFLIFF